MRISLIVPTFPKISETFVISKFVGLHNNKLEIHIVCAKSMASDWKFIAMDLPKGIGSRVHAIWSLQPRLFVMILYPFAFLRCLQRTPFGTWRYLQRGWGRFGADILRRLYLDAELIVLQPDIIHFEFGALAIDRMYLKELLDCKITVSFRGYDLNTSGLDDPHYYHEVWQHADAIHLLSQDLWRRAQQRGCPVEITHVLLPPAIDAHFFYPSKNNKTEPVGTPEQPLRILSVGRLDWRKGYEYAMQAVRMVIDNGLDCQYHIIGDGEYLEAVAFARHQLNLDDKVALLSAQNQSEIKAQMEWADVFLHAAVSEGFSNAVLEAQAMELPVICSDAGGLPENVADGETGFIVPRRDAHALAEKMILLAKNPELRERMGAAGRRRVEQLFQLDQQIKAFENFYQSVNNEQHN